MPCPCRVFKGLDCVSHFMYTVRPCLIHTNHAVLKVISQGHGTAWHGMCELMWTVERWPVSNLPTFSFIQLLHGHSQKSLTRKMLPLGVCLIVPMTKEMADYTEYELTFKLTPVFLLLLCYVSIVYSFLARHPHCVLIIHKQREKIRCRLTV